MMRGVLVFISLGAATPWRKPIVGDSSRYELSSGSLKYRHILTLRTQNADLHISEHQKNEFFRSFIVTTNVT